MNVLLVVYDPGMYIYNFPQGLAYIASALENAGHTVTVYNQDLHHYKDEHLTKYLNQNRFDIVGISFVAGYYQYAKILKLSDAINNSKNRPFYVLGGHGPSPEPEFFLKKTKADAVVIGEGDVTIVELLRAIEKKEDLSKVDGIAFRINASVTINKRRKLIKDIDSLPLPSYKHFPIEFYRLWRPPHAETTDFVMPLLSARGCPFTCNFCYRMDKGYRARGSESIIEEIRFLKKNYNINYILFSDELLMSSEKKTFELCSDFIKAKLNIKFFCNGRLNYATPKVLKIMKKAGCIFVNYGIESMDDTVLSNMNKKLNVKSIVSGIENTLKSGISPGFNIIFGNIGDNKKTLDAGVEFLLKYDDCSQLRTIRPVTPYPGSELYDYAIKNGMIKDIDDFYENKHKNSDLLTVNFTDMSDDEFYSSLMKANEKLIKNYYSKISAKILIQSKKLYLKKNTAFRGFRTV